MAQVAYDLAYFQREERQSAPRMRVAKPPVSETRRQVGRMMRTLLAVAFLLGLVCAVLYTQTNLNEMQRQIAEMNTRLTEEQSNYAYLSFELENMTSLKSIEARAAELGMEKITGDQISYFRVEEGEDIQVRGSALDKLMSEAQNGPLENLVDGMNPTGGGGEEDGDDAGDGGEDSGQGEVNDAE